MKLQQEDNVFRKLSFKAKVDGLYLLLEINLGIGTSILSHRSKNCFHFHSLLSRYSRIKLDRWNHL